MDMRIHLTHKNVTTYTTNTREETKPII